MCRYSGAYSGHPAPGPDTERRLEAEEQRLGAKQGGARLLREVVTSDEIAAIVARWTGIRVSRLQEGERAKVLRLDQVLHERHRGPPTASICVSGW